MMFILNMEEDSNSNKVTSDLNLKTKHNSILSYILKKMLIIIFFNIFKS